ncbi:MAG: TrbI/VirB10 family protein [Sphingobium sp.]|uniref:TrbI/VirB10 family protein n=1 Tax=Sphingobium sp. TaxID=1912891 RepID=UPI000C43579F|nr:TrbI/VirB10 family protein [Sphingobium sp.]MBU0660310.1 conjugal transfer protein TrbI [Alphaproteobacteria bacterium]MBS88576.1 conjugal transfer protein TrbI [Sphingobium sp.]MBU0774883.1 conjugal transfer protein TrbI [Alphaproteobacteria bacterium]MBU0867521.1 conjugal transfer protein TrbI [Alphaproteobacteria bacterium]MBU1464052.1 conjugal transfer protein TrbI [Alphaproteobacteria bacterium]
MTVETAAPPVSETPATPGKVDPETLALRAQPARAIRFKRGAVVAIAALGSVSLIATAWLALRPSALYLARQADDQAVAAKAPTDTLSRLPGSYGDVPKLGPPLPGDLGRPILNHQRAMGVESASASAGRADQAAATERDRRAAELKAARESELLVQSGNRTDPTRGAAATPSSPPAVARDASRIAINPDRDPNAQQRKADFVAARDTGGDVNEHRLSQPASSNMLSAGSVIAASLITGLRSDLPGLVTAQVTERVFDSATGNILLIPQGARLIGSYDSVVAFGQQRALVVWQRIISPDGSSIKLDNVPATDPSGYAGLADKVDFHTWALLKGVAISTLLGVGANVTFSGESDLVQAIRQSTQQNVSRAGEQITSRNLQIQPTITIRPGAPVRLIVHRDLILAPWTE